MKTDLELAQDVVLQPIEAIADRVGFSRDFVEPYGRGKAKIRLDAMAAFGDKSRPRGRLIAVTAMTPTPHGEGKTVNTIGLVDGLNRLGKKTIGALRQPSLGPIFGLKGGATGGGRAQLVPRADINLHFTGDFHAVAAAQNLLAAMTDNHVFHGNPLGIEPTQIQARRTVDMNDRALRRANLEAGERGALRQEAGFDIVAASEVMAVLMQTTGRLDLKKRLGRMIVGVTADGRPVTASELRAEGAMAAVLNHAIEPNLVQTMEGNPVLVHTGPFANVALGNSSVIADIIALSHADFVVTESGFGSDCGFEKLIDVKCRQGDYLPAAAVIVATVRALKWHGEGAADVLRAGCENLAKHIENVTAFGCPCVVAINQFDSDTEEELNVVREEAERLGATVVRSRVYGQGGEGGMALGEAVLEAIGKGATVAPLYPLEWDIERKVNTLATKVYGAKNSLFSDRAKQRLEFIEKHGYGTLPICIAKTPASFSHDAKLRGRPRDFTFPIEDLRVYAGAGYVLALAGPILTMPGLPRVPSAESIDVEENGRVRGL